MAHISRINRNLTGRVESGGILQISGGEVGGGVRVRSFSNITGRGGSGQFLFFSFSRGSGRVGSGRVYTACDIWPDPRTAPGDDDDFIWNLQNYSRFSVSPELREIFRSMCESGFKRDEGKFGRDTTDSLPCDV